MRPAKMDGVRISTCMDVGGSKINVWLKTAVYSFQSESITLPTSVLTQKVSSKLFFFSSFIPTYSFDSFTHNTYDWYQMCISVLYQKDL